MKTICLEFSDPVMTALEAYATRRETTVETIIREHVAERTLPIIEAATIPEAKFLMDERVAARERYFAAVKPVVTIKESR